MGTKVAVLGAGSWGTAMSIVLGDAGCEVRLWGRRPELTTRVQQDRVNSEYLPQARIPDGVTVTADAAEALRGAEIVMIAIPSQVLRESLPAYAGYLPSGAIVVSLMKGVEVGTCLRMTEMLQEECGIADAKIAVLTGPNLAPEVAARQPSACVVASPSAATAQRVADACSTSYFHPAVSDDIIGCEIAGATKNVTAIAVGVAEGMHLGENTKSTVLTRGLAEMVRLGRALGADQETFSGLAGVGDLVATCMSPASRNHNAGVALGQGGSIEEALGDGGAQVAEGLRSCEALLALARRHKVEMPIVESVVAVVQGGLLPTLLAEALMARERKAERA